MSYTRSRRPAFAIWLVALFAICFLWLCAFYARADDSLVPPLGPRSFHGVGTFVVADGGTGETTIGAASSSVDTSTTKAVAAVAAAPLGSTATVTTPDGATITLKPFIDALMPYIIAGLGTLITALFAWAVTKFQKATNIQIQAQQVASAKSAFATEAGTLVAGALNNLGNKTFHVGSPEVAAAVANVEKRIPDTIDALRKSGATPEALETMMTGEIGKLQATSTVVGVTPPPAVVAIVEPKT